MRKKGISKKILKITEGIFSTLTDLVLWNVFFIYQISPMGRPLHLRRAEFSANRQLEKFNWNAIRRTVYRAKARGWIKDDLNLTKEGIERLQNFIPVYFGERKWDGSWYLVSYDIPEFRRKLRNILRENLRKLGFGEMHASLWICPYNFLGEVEEIIKDYNLSSYVILAISNKVGREESKIFANKIWKLDELNDSYERLVTETKAQDPKNLIFEYLTILKQDPQLPKELLPEHWVGEEAYLVFKKYLFKL